VDTAIGMLRTTVVIFAVVAVLFGIYIRQLAEITSAAAASVGVGAAAAVLDAGDWDCTTTDPLWPSADRAAFDAVAARVAAGPSTVATDYTLTAAPSCTLVATVTVAAAGARSWLEATSVVCRPTRSAHNSGWALPAPC